MKPGRVLTERDHAELQEPMDRRSSRNRRLCAEIAKLQMELRRTR